MITLAGKCIIKDLKNLYASLQGVHQKNKIMLMTEYLKIIEISNFSTIFSYFRKGQMCSRCLRNVSASDSEVPGDDDNSILDELMTSTHRSSFSMDVQVSRQNMLVRHLGFLSLSQCFF